MNTTCLLHPLTNKYQPHTVCYPHDKWSSSCQEMSVCWWQHLKKIHVGCQELCLHLMWNDTYMTAKSEHNCSLNNEKKWSQWLQGTTLSHPLLSFSRSLFLTSVLLLPWKSWSSLAAKAPANVDLKCWGKMLCLLFYSLEDAQFQFGLNAFACSLRMVGQCVSGETKM